MTLVRQNRIDLLQQALDRDYRGTLNLNGIDLSWMLAYYKLQHCQKRWSMLQTYKIDPANIRHLATVVNWAKAMIKLHKEDLPRLGVEYVQWEEYNRKHDPIHYNKLQLQEQIKARKRLRRELEDAKDILEEESKTLDAQLPDQAKEPLVRCAHKRRKVES